MPKASGRARISPQSLNGGAGVHICAPTLRCARAPLASVWPFGCARHSAVQPPSTLIVVPVI
jgi:hypothetical protein